MSDRPVESHENSQPEVVTLEPQRYVVVRERVPMSALSEFFGRAFATTAASADAAGLRILGPPAAIYFGMPTDSADVAAGFPVDGPVDADGVTEEMLPGGQAAQMMHVGSYDSLSDAYGRLMEWMKQQDVTPGEVMWESYVNEPDEDAPQNSRTLIVWPLAS